MRNSLLCLHNLTNCKRSQVTYSAHATHFLPTCRPLLNPLLPHLNPLLLFNHHALQLQFLAAIIEINFQAEQTSNNLGVIA